MERCKHLEVIDKNVGNDIFDHPTYAFYCHKRNKNIINERFCKACDYYITSIIYDNLEKAIFIDGTMVLGDENDSVNFHSMTHEDTEILGQFCDFTSIHGDDLREVLLLGFLNREKGNNNK